MAELTQDRRDAAPARGGVPLTCVHCGSHRLRRSHPKSLLESLVRALTPLRLHRCSECGARGHHWAWAAPSAARPEEPARPAHSDPRRERHDALARRARRRRFLFTVLIATVLGALAGAAALSR